MGLYIGENLVSGGVLPHLRLLRKLAIPAPKQNLMLC